MRSKLSNKRGMSVSYAAAVLTILVFKSRGTYIKLLVRITSEKYDWGGPWGEAFL